MKDKFMAEKFRLARIEKGLSIRALSDLARVSHHTVGKLESANGNISEESVKKLADALGIEFVTENKQNEKTILDQTNPRHREKVCKGCFYWRRLSGIGTDKACHFLHDTGKLCGIDMDNLVCPNKTEPRKYRPVPPVVPR